MAIPLYINGLRVGEKLNSKFFPPKIESENERKSHSSKGRYSQSQIKGIAIEEESKGLLSNPSIFISVSSCSTLTLPYSFLRSPREA